MTAKLQDLIDARRLCVDTLADLDAAIARDKHGEIVGYTITARTICDKGGNVIYRIEEPTPRPQDVITFTINDWHKQRRVAAAHSMHRVYDDYSNVRYSCRNAVLSGWNAISRLVRATRDAIQARSSIRSNRTLRSTAVRRTTRAGTHHG